MGNTSLKEHLPSTSSIYTAELRAILLAFKLINKSFKEHFVICTDSLSSLMAIRTRVDVLAKLALNEAYTNIKIPYTDLVYYAKFHLRKNWQFFWDQQVQSKLHAVHPELGLWPHSSQERRRDELILCRLHIGHTHLTHRHLLVGDPPPVCVSCQERLSVEHILIHCAEYIDIRVSCFNVNTVRTV